MIDTKNEILDRQPPADLDAEAGVLCSLLGWPERLQEVASVLSPRDFYDEANASLFRVMVDFDREGKPINDATLLLQKLVGKPGWPDRDSVVASIARLTNLSPTGTNASLYADRVRETARKRRLLQVAESTLQAAHNGQNPDDILVDLRADIETLDGDNTHAEAKPVGLSDLVADNPRLAEPVIDGLLRKGETANIIAAPKVGKSWLSYGLALSVATGDEWLGQFPCGQGRVLVIDNELHPSTLAKRLPDVAQALSLRTEQYFSQIDLLSLRGRLTDLHGIAKSLQRVPPGEYKLVILDAWYRAVPDGVSENDNAGVAGLYNLVDRIAGRLQCAWVNVHHASKGSQSEKAVTDVGAGAGSQSRAADAHIVLRPHEEEGAVVMEAAVRSFPPIEPLPLRWTFPVWQPDDCLDASKLKGRGTRQEERQAQRDKEGMVAILGELRKGTGSSRDLQGRTGLSRPRGCSLRFAQWGCLV